MFLKGLKNESLQANQRPRCVLICPLSQPWQQTFVDVSGLTRHDKERTACVVWAFSHGGFSVVGSFRVTLMSSPPHRLLPVLAWLEVLLCLSSAYFLLPLYCNDAHIWQCLRGSAVIHFFTCVLSLALFFLPPSLSHSLSLPLKCYYEVNRDLFKDWKTSWPPWPFQWRTDCPLRHHCSIVLSHGSKLALSGDVTQSFFFSFFFFSFQLVFNYSDPWYKTLVM